MTRSKWKGPFLNFKDLQTIKTQKKQSNSSIISRNSEIIPQFVGSNFKVYNGKKYSEITVTDKMVGHKFGEFSFTRGRFLFKKKKSKK